MEFIQRSNQQNESIQHLMALLRLPGVGIVSYWKLVETFNNPLTIVSAQLKDWPFSLSARAKRLWLDYQQQQVQSELALLVARDLDWCNENRVTLLSHFDDKYPKDLRQIHHCPPLLYIWGDVDCLSMPQIAIVGSRKPSALGRQNALTFAAQLAASGFTITSGLALGIDVAAHEGALKGGGTTLAVLGTGIDKIYPFRHKKIAKRIVDSGGAIISEFPCGMSAHKSNFPQRNRVISALSCGVLVVEAALKSGSLITARYALQQNREIFAVPGSIHNSLSSGCHYLIRQGAALVENCQDIVDQLQGYIMNKQLELNQSDAENHLDQANDTVSCSKDEKALLDILSVDSLDLDELVEVSAFPIAELCHLLLCLEMKGHVVNDAGLYRRSSQLSFA